MARTSTTRRVLLLAICGALVLAASTSLVDAKNWPRFRGPNGTGVSPDQASTPVEWSEANNLKWSAEIPGPGLSCPIIINERVYLTCWSGYGLDRENPGDIENLKRHLVCFDRQSGQELWTTTVDAVLPEDKFEGMFAENGYATHTPVSDGEHIYVFFGKSGVLAYDLDGNELWRTGVGTELGMNNWGSASSPILHENLIIVPAAAESKSLVALDKTTGEEVWKFEDASFEGTWGTPVLAQAEGGRTDLVMAVPGKIWGFDPATGEQLWECSNSDSNSASASAFASDGIVYFIGGRNGGSIAVKAGGSGDVTDSHVVWQQNAQGRIGTPVLDDGRIYWINRGVANCIDAATGEEVYKERLEVPQDPAAEDQAEADGEGGGRGRGRGGRGGGNWMRSQNYSSPVAADGKLYFVSRDGNCFVLKLGGEFEQLAVNKFAANDGEVSSTPAISDGEIFIRQGNTLYCVATTGSL